MRLVVAAVVARGARVRPNLTLSVAAVDPAATIMCVHAGVGWTAASLDSAVGVGREDAWQAEFKIRVHVGAQGGSAREEGDKGCLLLCRRGQGKRRCFGGTLTWAHSVDGLGWIARWCPLIGSFHMAAEICLKSPGQSL